MKHTLEVDSIILKFGNKRVLQDVYLKSQTGEITGLLGRNGTGKTCLLNIIYGELAIIDKSVRLDGTIIYNGFRSPLDFRYLPQFSFIPKNLKIKRIFKDFQLNFNEFMNDFQEFKRYYNVKLGRLSGGEQRLIEVYSILKSKTKFCMLDEPFSHIMPVHAEKIKHILKREKKNKGIIITDHLYEHITEICDSLYVISNGKTFQTNDLNDLKVLGYVNRRNNLFN